MKRGGTSYVNEPHPGGGAAVLSSKDGVMFNDILGTTLGTQSEHGYASVAMTAFGDTADADALFTGKPLVEGLGHAFLFRNYRAGLGKWLTADPLGYPDGWNQLAYGVNSPVDGFDYMGGSWSRWDDSDFTSYYFTSNRIYGDFFDTDCMGLTREIFWVISDAVLPKVYSQIYKEVRRRVDYSEDQPLFMYTTSRGYDFGGVCFSLGSGVVRTYSIVRYSYWDDVKGDQWVRHFKWSFTMTVDYSDIFMDPLDLAIEIPGGSAFAYFHQWKGLKDSGTGSINMGLSE